MNKQEFIDYSFSRIASNYEFIKGAVLQRDDKQISLLSLSLQKNERDYYSLYNRLNSFLDINKEQKFVPLFITLTSNKHKQFKLLESNYLKALSYSKGLLRSNNAILRDVFKSKRREGSNTIQLFRKEDYNYIKSVETHKTGVFHTHICIFVKKELAKLFITKFIHFYSEKKEKYSLGRVEICVDNKEYIHPFFKYSNKHKIYLHPDFSFKTGDFLYFKKLKIKEKDNQYGIISYIAKYAIKTLKDKKELKYDSNDLQKLLDDKHKLLDVSIFRHTRIRRLSFSRLLFNRKEYDTLKGSNNKKIYDYYTYKELYELQKKEHIQKNYKYIKSIKDNEFDILSISFIDCFTKKEFDDEYKKELLEKTVLFLKEKYSYFNKYFKKYKLSFKKILYDYNELIKTNYINFISAISDLIEDFELDITDESFYDKELVSIQILCDVFSVPQDKKWTLIR